MHFHNLPYWSGVEFTVDFWETPTRSCWGRQTTFYHLITAVVKCFHKTAASPVSTIKKKPNMLCCASVLMQFIWWGLAWHFIWNLGGSDFLQELGQQLVFVWQENLTSPVWGDDTLGLESITESDLGRKADDLDQSQSFTGPGDFG